MPLIVFHFNFGENVNDVSDRDFLWKLREVWYDTTSKATRPYNSGMSVEKRLGIRGREWYGYESQGS